MHNIIIISICTCTFISDKNVLACYLKMGISATFREGLHSANTNTHIHTHCTNRRTQSGFAITRMAVAANPFHLS